ncbi:Thymine dioxygenase [Bertholletia excelsa]
MLTPRTRTGRTPALCAVCLFFLFLEELEIGRKLFILEMENSKEAYQASKNASILNCIDLSSDDVHKSVSLLKQACLDSGFFYVINHGISQEFMDVVFHQSKRFFDLPLSEKMTLLRNKKNRGYTPVLDEHLDPVNQLHGDYKEGYYIGVEVAVNDPDSQRPFYGPNVWPAADILPGWRETMEKYHQEAYQVAKVVARIIALALDLDAGFFDQQEMLGKPITTLRLLHYEGRISDPKEGIYGAGAHTDFGLMTLLATDDVYGLQICKDKDAKPQKWEFVAPLKGAFIVNIGDMLERWSNCIFRSTLHRVLGNGQERYSIAYFVEPSHDCLVGCLPTCQSQENPPKFSPIKCETYLLNRYKETHADLASYQKQ